MRGKIKNVIFILLSGGLLWLWQYNEDRIAEAKTLTTDPVALSLENAVMYQYGQTGSLTTRISGQYIEHMKNGENHFIAPELKQITPQGSRILKAKFGAQSANQQTITLRGNVFAEESQNGQTVAALHTNQLQYERPQQLITTDSTVILDTPESHTTADGAQWQMQQNLFILKKNIRSSYVPAL